MNSIRNTRHVESFDDALSRKEGMIPSWQNLRGGIIEKSAGCCFGLEFLGSYYGRKKQA